MRGNFYFFIFISLLLTAPAQAKDVAGLQVEGIRYGGAGEKTRIVFDLNKKTDFRAFMLDQPYRVVLDLPKAVWKTYKSQFVLNKAVRAYRSGELNEGLTRVIFDVKQPMIIDSAFLVEKNSFNKDRLVIDLAPSSLQVFSARKDRIFGNRYLKGSGASKMPPASDYAAIENDLVKAAIPASVRAAPPVVKPVQSPREPEKKYVIVIDPGHGGADPGATSQGIKEKNLNLAVAEELRGQLEETGRYKAVLTREKDVYIKLYERVDIARRVKGDLFISIHADKIDRKGVRGVSIYTLSEKASDAETERLAEEENNAGFVAGVDLSQESQDVADILLDLAMREKMNESNLFSRMLTHTLLRKKVRLLPNSHRSAGFAVLKAPDVPSILIETGFISNPDEAKLLNSGQFQRNISKAIVEGIDAYFRKIQELQKP